MWRRLSWVGRVSGILLALFVFMALFAPWIAGDSKNPEDWLPLIKFGPESADIFTSPFLAAPDSAHLFGTDYIGRDVFARVVHATKNSLLFSVAVMIASVIIGTLVGAVMGFFAGRLDMILSRIIEVISNFPIFLLQLTFLAIFGSNYFILFFVMIFSNWISYARYTRAEFFRLRNLEFVQAARVLGSSRSRIIFRHLLPNSLTPILVLIPFDLASTIIGLGGLSFLGFGEPIHVASFGELLNQAREHFQRAWWLAVFPGGALFLLTLSLALFGAAVRDMLDPRLGK
mgnify:CR=1 FL=1